MKKKGNASDIAVVSILLFGFVLLLVIFLFLAKIVIPPIVAMLPPTAEALFLGVLANFFTWWDTALLVGYLIFWTASMASAFFLDASRVFYLIFLCLATCALFAALPLMEFVVLFIDQFNGMATDLPLTYAVAQFWPFFITFYFVTLLVAVYAKGRGADA